MKCALGALKSASAMRQAAGLDRLAQARCAFHCRCQRGKAVKVDPEPTTIWPREPAVPHRRPHPFAGLLHGRVRQPDNRGARQLPAGDVHLHLEQLPIETDYRAVQNGCKHRRILARGAGHVKRGSWPEPPPIARAEVIVRCWLCSGYRVGDAPLAPIRLPASYPINRRSMLIERKNRADLRNNPHGSVQNGRGRASESVVRTSGATNEGENYAQVPLPPKKPAGHSR